MYELESADALIFEYFNRFFAIIKSDIPKKVELTSASMLAELAKETDVPKKAIELLLGHFHPAVIKTNPAASHLATLVCNEASNELQMHVNQVRCSLLSKKQKCQWLTDCHFFNSTSARPLSRRRRKMRRQKWSKHYKGFTL